MDQAFSRLHADARKGMFDTDFYRRVSQILAMIRCSHTKADQSPQMELWRNKNASHFPFRFRIIEGRMIVISSDPLQAPLQRGSEILSINGVPVTKIIKSLGAYVSIDGQTKGARAAYLAQDSDLMGSDFDHFYPYVFGFRESFDLRLRDHADAPVRQLSLTPIRFPAWAKLPYDGQPYRQDFVDAVTWRMLTASTGYLRVDTFVNYRKPTDPVALYGKALRELRKSGARALILDLRRNGGGSNDAALALIDALTTSPYVFQSAMRYRAVRYGDLPRYISTWGNRDALFNPPLERFIEKDDGWFDLRPELAPQELLPRQPAADPFSGPLIILSGPLNASGATMVISKLRDMGRAQILGEPSGGSGDGPTAGTIFNLRLPNSHISVRIPLVFNKLAVRNFAPKGGLKPDILVVERAADVRNGVDRQLQRAVIQFSP